VGVARHRGGRVTATEHEVGTPHGPARVQLHAAVDPRGALVLGHGAGGSITAPDLVAVTAAAVALGVSVVLVEQPYRVAGRRTAAPARQLDAAWIAVVADLRAHELAGLALVTGGRSSGARVACRTADAVGAVGVLCLAFPLRPPRRAPKPPADSRLPELEAVTVPVLIVQGARDRFGMPVADPAAAREVVEVPGDHALRTTAPVAAAAGSWLAQRLALVSWTP
jgi:predicted alpha/beta-hydrolase family hydrolase